MIDARERALVIIDDAGGSGEVPSLAGALDLLAFSGDWVQIETWLTRLGETGAAVTLLDGAQLLAGETEALRTALPDWTERIGRHAVDGRTVREWLSAADGQASAFWYGSIAERNAFKSPEFLVVAQARVVDRCARSGQYGRAVLRCRPGIALETFASICAGHGLVVDSAGNNREDAGRVTTRALREGAAALAKFAVRGLLARGLTLGRVTRRDDRNPLLCVTYYPFLDRAQAANGRFENRYFGPLQGRIEEQGRPIWWAAIFVFIDGWGFRGAVALTRRLARTGQRIAMLDAYFTPAAAARVAGEWMRIRRRALRLMRVMGPAITGGLLPDCARPLAQRLWVRSYAGADLARGLYYAEVFRLMMPETTAAPTCVYQAEFQAWEHALNARAAQRPVPLRTIGFQHTSVSRNYFFYFHQPSERTGPLPLPMPGTLAFSGVLPERIVADCQYPSTRRVEAVRQLHLADVLAAPVTRGGTPVLLVAGSIDRAESRAILSLVAKAFPRAERVRIALRSHPSQPLAPLCAELGFDIGAAGYETFSGTTDEALRAATLVLVGSSSLAVEALAYECDVIAPVFASFLPLTPLSGFEEIYERVYNPAGLRAAVERFLSAGPAQSAAAKRDFVQQYWIIDRSLSGWMALLDERPGDGPAPAATLPA